MHGTLSCPICGTTSIALGATACPSCSVAFASPVVAPAYSPPVADRWAPTMLAPPSTATPPVSTAVAYASIWRRMGAGVIDVVIVMIPFVLIQGAAYFDTSDTSGFLYFNSDPLFWLETLAFLFYAAAFQSSSKQATPGMQVMNLRLVREDDLSQVSFARAAMRDVATWLSAILLFVGYLMIAFTKKRQALHDKLVSTVVVHDA